jgi:mRNA interferase MazF
MTEGRSVTKSKVVLVPFPFDDLTATKIRPAVCRTEPVGLCRHIVLAFVTSRIPAALTATDTVLDTWQPGMAATGLRIPSTGLPPLARARRGPTAPVAVA